jgi:hypothetical protein
MLSTSLRVRAEHFAQPWFQQRRAELHLIETLHRKHWEYCVISQLYAQHLRQGGRVLGFGVGQEPLPAWFASRGASVLATDQPPAQAGAWAETGQYAGGLLALQCPTICDPETFTAQVGLAYVDMTALPEPLCRGAYDLCWSACAVEHLGSIEAALQFLTRVMATLRPGGLSVHTTELQTTEFSRRLAAGGTVLFQPEDLLALHARLDAQGDQLWTLDLQAGDLPADRHVDEPPFTGDTPHLQLRVFGEVGGRRQDFVTTSVALVMERGGKA